jgi:molybdopterin-binding protein
MAMNETIKFILQNKDSLNPAVLRTVLDDFGISDNKAEIELLAQENNVYTPAEGKVYNKVTVNVPGPTLETLTITDTSVTEYNAPEGKAYNKVVIQVNTEG